MHKVRSRERAIDQTRAGTDPGSAGSALNESPGQSVKRRTMRVRAIRPKNMQPLPGRGLRDIRMDTAIFSPLLRDFLGRSRDLLAEQPAVSFEV